MTQVDLAGHPAVDHQAVATGGPEVGNRLVGPRPVDPERVLDPGHRAAAAPAERPEPLAEAVELLVRPGREAEMVAAGPVGQPGPAERDRAGRPRHVGVVLLQGQQLPSGGVLEPQRPRGRAGHRDEATGRDARSRPAPFGIGSTGVWRDRLDQRQPRLRARPFGPGAAQADPDHPVGDRRHLDGQRIAVAGLASEHRLAAAGRVQPGAGQCRGLGHPCRGRRKIADLARGADSDSSGSTRLPSLARPGPRGPGHDGSRRRSAWVSP